MLRMLTRVFILKKHILIFCSFANILIISQSRFLLYATSAINKTVTFWPNFEKVNNYAL